jgi:HTH-type transcriptional regulator / antitoxin HigA
MPSATYEQLLSETLPQVIETEDQYRQIGARFGDLVGKARSRTPDETKLMRLLALLVEDYDRRHAMPPDNSTPAERLRFLLDHSGAAASELVSVFGQPSRVDDALLGKNPISAEEARQLGKLFRVNPGLFI